MYDENHGQVPANMYDENHGQVPANMYDENYALLSSYHTCTPCAKSNIKMPGQRKLWLQVTPASDTLLFGAGRAAEVWLTSVNP
jgi:hypothetical protein